METKNIKELIDSFQRQIDGFKEQLTTQLDDKEKQRLQEELEEKKGLIALLIDDLKPLELEITEKNTLISELGGKLEEYALDMAKLKEDNEANHIRLEKLNALLDAKKKESAATAAENENLKKELFKEQNKLAALEAKTFSTDDKNQKLANELVHARQQLKEVQSNSESEILRLRQELEQAQQRLEVQKRDDEAKRERLMELHAKKVSMVNAQVASLRAQMLRTEKEMSARTEKEKQLITDFASRLRDITAPTPGVAMEEEEELLPTTDFYDRITADFVDYQESKVEEMLPMVEIAIQQGESRDKIKRSLKNSGYKEKEIIEVFQTLKLQ